MKKRICQFPQCKTVLNSVNKVEGFCCLHQRVIAQNNLIYIEKPFVMKAKVKIKKGFYKSNPREIKTSSPLKVAMLCSLKGLPIDLPDETQD